MSSDTNINRSAFMAIKKIMAEEGKSTVREAAVIYSARNNVTARAAEQRYYKGRDLYRQSAGLARREKARIPMGIITAEAESSTRLDRDAKEAGAGTVVLGNGNGNGHGDRDEIIGALNVISKVQLENERLQERVELLEDQLREETMENAALRKKADEYDKLLDAIASANK